MSKDSSSNPLNNRALIKIIKLYVFTLVCMDMEDGLAGCPIQ